MSDLNLNNLQNASNSIQTTFNRNHFYHALDYVLFPESFELKSLIMDYLGFCWYIC